MDKAPGDGQDAAAGADGTAPEHDWSQLEPDGDTMAGSPSPEISRLAGWAEE